MAYRKIEVGTKNDAVIRVLRGERLTDVAREMGVNRNSVSLWIHRAMQAIKRDLKSNRKPLSRKRNKQAEKLQKLKDLVHKKEMTIKRLQASLKTSQGEPRPSRCSRCGCERFYKNGLVRLQLENLLKIMRNGTARKIPVQKFVCVNCGHATHLEGPTALYYWAVSSAKGNS